MNGLTLNVADLLRCPDCRRDRVEVTAWHHFYVTLNPFTGEVGLEPSHEVEPCLTVYCGRSCGFWVEELHHLVDVARVVLPAGGPGHLRCATF